MLLIGLEARLPEKESALGGYKRQTGLNPVSQALAQIGGAEIQRTGPQLPGANLPGISLNHTILD